MCQPALWQALKRRTEALERLVVETCAWGLSTRDIEDALAELAGEGWPLLGSTVSRTAEVLHEELEALAYSDLSGLDVVDLFAGPVYESLRRHAGCREGVTVTCTILRYGSKELVHLSLGNKERYEDWLEHFRDPVRRGLKAPVTVLRTMGRGWSGQWRPGGWKQSASAAGSTRCGTCRTKHRRRCSPCSSPTWTRFGMRRMWSGVARC
jgi:transposase-like protein